MKRTNDTIEMLQYQLRIFAIQASEINEPTGECLMSFTIKNTSL